MHGGRRDWGWGSDLPAGNYRKSCRSIRVDGRLLKASCQRGNGTWRDSSLDLRACERDIVNYVRQLLRANRVDQATFDALRKRHDEKWMVELTAAANYFALLSGVVNAFEVAAPPDGDKLPV